MYIYKLYIYIYNSCGWPFTLFLLPSGCYITSPYLDKYGESDQGLKRGNPLYLNSSQYEKLHTDWLSHTIPNVIAQTMENVTGIYVTEWQQLWTIKLFFLFFTNSDILNIS